MNSDAFKTIIINEMDENYSKKMNLPLENLQLDPILVIGK